MVDAADEKPRGQVRRHRRESLLAEDESDVVPLFGGGRQCPPHVEAGLAVGIPPARKEGELAKAGGQAVDRVRVSRHVGVFQEYRGHSGHNSRKFSAVGR